MKRARERKESLRRRKNFIPVFLMSVFFWFLLFGIIYFIEPDSALAIPTFFLIFFLALFSTSSLIFRNRRRALFVTIAITLFLFLRLLGLGNLLNLLVLLGIFVAAELYFLKR